DGIERVGEIDTVVFEKTGTLTNGFPILINESAVSDEILRAAGAIAAASSHPYAKAVAAGAQERFSKNGLASGVEETPGKGLERETPGGKERLGSAAWCGVADGERHATLWFTRPGAPPVPFQFEDVLRPDAAETIIGLERAACSVHLLSGDREEAVQKAAAATGIEDWRAGLKRQDKKAILD